MRAVNVVLLATFAFADANFGFAAGNLTDCEDAGLESIVFPAETLLTRAECEKAGGQLCQGVSHSMGHRTTQQVLCYRGASVIGGIDGTLKKSGP